MKKHVTTIQRKAVTLLVASALIFSTATMSYASTDSNQNTVKGVEISYKGVENSLLVFNVDYKNELSKTFQLVVKNDQNEVLFVKKYDAKPLNTSIRLSAPSEKVKISIAIETGKKEFSQSFEIDSKIKTVEEFVVKGI